MSFLTDSAVAALKEVNAVLNGELRGVDLSDLRGDLSDTAVQQAWTRVMTRVRHPLNRFIDHVFAARRHASNRKRTAKHVQWTLVALLTVGFAIGAAQAMSVMESPDLSKSGMARVAATALWICVTLAAMAKLWMCIVESGVSLVSWQVHVPAFTALKSWADILGFRCESPAEESLEGDAVETDCLLPLSVMAPTEAVARLDTLSPGFRAIFAASLQQIKDGGVQRFESGSLWTCVAEGVQALRGIAYNDTDLLDASSAATQATVTRLLDEKVIPLLLLPLTEVPGVDVPETLPQDMRHVPEGDASRLACWKACASDPSLKVAVYVPAPGGPGTMRCMCSSSYDVFESFEFSSTSSGTSDAVAVRRPGQSSDPHVYVCGYPSDPSKQSAAQIRYSEPIGDPKDACDRDDQCRAISGDSAYRLPASQTFETFLGGLSDQRGRDLYCVRTRASDVYRYGLKAKSKAVSRVDSTGVAGGVDSAGVVGGVENMMRDSAPSIAIAIVSISSEFRVRLDWDKLRPFMDARLRAYYGDATFYRIRPVVNDVLADVDAIIRKRADGAGVLGRSRYVDPDRMLAKLRAMSTTRWQDLDRVVTAAATCASTHIAYFPMYEGRSALTRVSQGCLVHVVTLLVVGMLLAMCDSLIDYTDALKGIGHPKYASWGLLMRNVMVVVSVFVAVVVILEVLYDKHMAKTEHNRETAIRNGVRLSSALTEAAAALREARIAATAEATAGRNSSSISNDAVFKVDAAVHAVRLAIESFDMCNSITDGVRSMPFPMADIVFYVVIAVMFATMAALAWSKLDPRRCMLSINRLFKMRTKVLAGDVTGPEASDLVKSTIACCKTAGVAYETMAWFAVVTVFFATLWFLLTNVNNNVDTYRSALRVTSRDRCLA
jgi:hypothetical protein